MAEITIDTDALKDALSKISGSINQFGDINRALVNIISQIGEQWSGAASAAYTTSLQAYAGQAEAMRNVLTEYQEYVRKANEAFSTLDKDAAARIRSAF